MSVYTIDRRLMIGGTLLSIASSACGQRPASGNTLARFGVVGDGVADDAPAIQRAIDAAAAGGGGTVILDPGTYLLRYRPAEDGDGVSALTLRSGVTLRGTDPARCILRLADAQHGPGTYARTIASTGEITRAELRSFGIDGNRRGQGRFSGTISGAAVLLGWKGRCADIVIEELVVRDAVGQGIMLQGSIGNVSRNLRIARNLVERSSFIGIQCSQFDGVEIVQNRIVDCGDNGIDVYGDDTAGHSNVATSHRATVTGNSVRGCGIGVFLETVADCVAADNTVEDCRVAGVRINRIHGEPRNLTVERNRIAGTPSGVAIGGDTGGVLVRGNDIRGFTTAGVEFSYNVSRVTVTGNRFVPVGPAIPIVLGKPTVVGSVPEERLSFIQIADNRVPRGHDPSRFFVNGYRQMVDVDVARFVPE